jgi:hypothetical protein
MGGRKRKLVSAPAAEAAGGALSMGLQGSAGVKGTSVFQELALQLESEKPKKKASSNRDTKPRSAAEPRSAPASSAATAPVVAEIAPGIPWSLPMALPPPAPGPPAVTWAASDDDSDEDEDDDELEADSPLQDDIELSNEPAISAPAVAAPAAAAASPTSEAAAEQPQRALPVSSRKRPRDRRDSSTCPPCTVFAAAAGKAVRVRIAAGDGRSCSEALVVALAAGERLCFVGSALLRAARGRADVCGHVLQAQPLGPYVEGMCIAMRASYRSYSLRRAHCSHDCSDTNLAVMQCDYAAVRIMLCA